MLVSLVEAPVVAALHVVVTVDEQLLDVPPVPSLVPGEHRIPGIRHDLQLIAHARVGHVACDDHAVHVALAEIGERLLERARVAEDAKVPLRGVYMNVRDDAYAQVRRPRREKPRRRGKGATCRKRRRKADELPS